MKRTRFIQLLLEVSRYCAIFYQYSYWSTYQHESKLPDRLLAAVLMILVRYSFFFIEKHIHLLHNCMLTRQYRCSNNAIITMCSYFSQQQRFFQRSVGFSYRTLALNVASVVLIIHLLVEIRSITKL